MNMKLSPLLLSPFRLRCQPLLPTSLSRAGYDIEEVLDRRSQAHDRHNDGRRAVHKTKGEAEIAMKADKSCVTPSRLKSRNCGEIIRNSNEPMLIGRPMTHPPMPVDRH